MIDRIAEFILTRPHPRTRYSANKFSHFIKAVWLKIYFIAFERAEYFPGKKLAAIQEKRLINILSRARNSVTFYKKHLASIKTLNDFASLPPLTKQDMRTALDQGLMINQSLEKFKVKRSTSGSSGVPFIFYHDSNMYTRRIAFYHRLLRWIGYKKGDAAVWIMREMHPEFGAIPFVCFGPDDIVKRKFELYQILEGKPAILHAMTSHLVFLADLFEKDGKQFNFKGIISYAEPLHSEVRQYLEQKLKAPIFDNYGSQEILNPGNECEFHDGFHINSEWVLVEVIGKDIKPLPPGQVGTIVMTSFDNEVMPFIRYKIGDLGYWMEGKCPCGRTLPRLKMPGREINFFIHPNGQVGDFVSLVLPILKVTPKVLEFQVIRNTRTDFILRVVPTAKFDDDCRQHIVTNVQNYLGSTAKIDFEIIDSIPLGPGGKPRVFVNMQNDLQEFIKK